jgi:hypothetical protein
VCKRRLRFQWRVQEAAQVEVEQMAQVTVRRMTVRRRMVRRRRRMVQHRGGGQ